MYDHAWGRNLDESSQLPAVRRSRTGPRHRRALGHVRQGHRGLRPARQRRPLQQPVGRIPPRLQGRSTDTPDARTRDAPHVPPNALVTGASRGIGAAIARGLSVAGYRVFVNYRADAEGARAVVEQIVGGGRRCGGRAGRRVGSRRGRRDVRGDRGGPRLRALPGQQRRRHARRAADADGRCTTGTRCSTRACAAPSSAPGPRCAG